MAQKTRVRFAPSPTGALHIGGVRTALFNYLFAKQHGGDFILRIEDTDQARYVEGAEKYIINSLEWCGIPFNEGPGKPGDCGPYRQSERKTIYQEHIKTLLSSGHAYYAFDTASQLDGHRIQHEQQGKTFIYNWHNRLKLTNSLSLSPEETAQRIHSGEAYTIRFKSPKDQTLSLNDMIRGEITIDTNILDDKVLFKSDGMPTYHLANVVDDHLMRISHVIRGEEWLPSMALHQLLYAAFGWEAPSFAHLPLIMKPTGKGKLSKRDGEQLGFPVMPLSWQNTIGYKEAGYFPEALINFLALLGWNSGTEKEIYSLEELINAFSLDRVHKAGARFDPEKTKWYNHHYLQQKSDETLAQLFLEEIKTIPNIAQHHKLADPNQLIKIVGLVKERATFVSDFWQLSAYFFLAPTSYDEQSTKKHWKGETAQLLNQLVTVISRMQDFSAQSIEENVKNWLTENGHGFGKVMPPLRLAIVGDMKGPHIYDIMQVIGKEETLERIQNATKKLAI